ncbi:MAG: hypothetical protein WAZ77_19395 [Candidatus Nitrosopolaris sp.]
MKKTLKFGGLIIAAILAMSIIAALNFTTKSTFAQNATSGNKATAAGNTTSGNTTGGNTASSSSAMPKSTTSSAVPGPKY